MFSSLRHRNYRLYIGGQFVSLIGTWMQQLATSWMVYRMTNAPIWLGISMFSAQIPMFALGLFGGVFVDRVNRRKLLMWTQSLSAIQALILAVLTLAHWITLHELIGLNLVLGTINAFDMPARHAFVVEMIEDRRDLPNAIALNSSVMNATRLIGPAIAGAAIGLFGEGVCFMLNSLSYVAVLIALMLMHVPRRDRRRSEDSLLESMRQGLKAVTSSDAIRTVLILLAFMSLVGMPFLTLLPALAARVPGGGARTLGLLTGTGAAGSLLGALYLARKGSPILGRVIAASGLIFSTFLIVLSFMSRIEWMLVCVFFAGMGMLLQMSCSNTIIQAMVSDEERGRVLSFFNFSLLGVAPFGSLLIGSVAQRLGLDRAFLICGILCLVGALVFARRADQINRRIATRIGLAA